MISLGLWNDGLIDHCTPRERQELIDATLAAGINAGIL
jgi:hypothetical protein